MADDFQRWSGKYDRKLSDLFALQDEIAQAVVASLETALNQKPDPLPDRRRISPEAYNLYLQGRSAELNGGSLESVAILGWAYARAGKPVEATKVLEDLRQRSHSIYVSPVLLAQLVLGLGEKNRLSTILIKLAGARRRPGLAEGPAGHR